MDYVTYALLAVMAVLWMFVLYRVFRALDYFSQKQAKRVQAIRAGANPDVPATEPAAPDHGASPGTAERREDASA